MRNSLLRCAESAFRRGSSSSSSHFLRRPFSSSASPSSFPDRKVTILGAAGGIGQPLSLLMKLNPFVSTLSLYDIAGTPGVAADVSHINTRAQVIGFVGEDQLGKALEGSDVVIIPAGVPRKPGMTRDDLFIINAGIVKSLAAAIAKHCPNALVNMISNPVNSTVPIAAEVFKKVGTFDEKKLFGVTTLDVVRAKTFYAGKAKVPVEDVNVPVVGGHAGITILPLFSQATPASNSLSHEDIKALTKRTQDGGTEVVEAKAGKGSATLSMAYAGAIFAEACLKGLNGVPDIVECSFVQSNVTELPFFASKIKTDVETQGDFIRFLIKEVENAAFSNIEDLVAFVKWLDDELSFLVDERAVLKHFDWPEAKSDAMREAAFGYCDLRKLEAEASSFRDDPRQPCSSVLKKMQGLVEKLEQGVYNISRVREGAMERYKNFQIPWDWMLDSGFVCQIKLASVKLAMKYMKRVTSENVAIVGGPEEEDLMLQGVRFAFRVHQFAGGFDMETMRAFQELKEKARKLQAHKQNQFESFKLTSRINGGNKSFTTGPCL